MKSVVDIHVLFKFDFRYKSRYNFRYKNFASESGPWFYRTLSQVHPTPALYAWINYKSIISCVLLRLHLGRRS